MGVNTEGMCYNTEKGKNGLFLDRRERKGVIFMYQYDPSEWLLFFYFYCFCGWIWECCYVSVKQKKWVNRGFLHGPFLPIYGSGAICVLLMTIPVKDNLLAVFFMGMLGATVLEYCTGLLMEKLFGVRYWDYSNVPFNLHGHICLMASLGWGIFSVIMIRIAHLPVEKMVFAISDTMRETLAIFITVVFAVDFTKSFQEAMDLKELMMRLTEDNEEIRRLQRRMDVIIAVLNEETDEFRERVEEGISKYREYLKEYKEKTEERKLEKRAAQEEGIKKYRQLKTELIESASHFANNLADQISVNEREKETDKLGEELEKTRSSIRRLRGMFEWNRKKELVSSGSILRRNPGVFSKNYAEALKEVQEMDKENQ